ncbi:fungal-specific transcription factor domain-containing protein [Aspergillus varians]
MPTSPEGRSSSIAKRHRPAYSCTECRRRKVRCDRTKPCCGQCRALDLASSCAYEDNRRPTAGNRTRKAPSSPSTGQRDGGTSEVRSVNPPAIQGTISKTRVFGHGHWMNTFSLMEGLSALKPIGELYQTFTSDCPRDELRECKSLAQTIKRQRPSRRCLPADIHRFFPDRVVMDQLVDLYFNTFESCYGILCYSLFMEEYIICMELQRPDEAESSFLLQVLLIMTIAAPLHDDAAVRSEVAANARIWIHIAQTWLSAPLEKDRLTLKAIQVHCLLLLSRQVNQVGPDLVWISAGSLMRIAMQMGLHQDPDLLGQMDFKTKHMRRRLWYTILEMNVQSAIDSGMSPMISDGDYTTQPPSNAITHETGEPDAAASKHAFQPLLASSISLRIRATKIINSMHEEPSYDQVLSLGTELASACRAAAIILNETSPPSSSTFATSFCSHLLRRFPLCLHFRYAIKAKINPLYSHSRHVCLEAALDLVNLLEDTLYSQVLRMGGGMFRDLITRGALVIFLELSPDPETDTSVFARKRHRVRLEPLLQDARRVVQYARDRASHGDMNVKTYVYLRMMLAQAEACLDGDGGGLVKEAVSSAMREGLGICRDILQVTAANCAEDSSARHPDLEFWAGGMVSPMRIDGNGDSDLDGLFDFDFAEGGFSQWAGQMGV